MNLLITFENGSQRDVPDEERFKTWVMASISELTCEPSNSEVNLRIIDEDEMTRFNSQFREQQKSTNVLSFPADIPTELKLELEFNLLGDIALCAPVIERESAEQCKTLEAHYAHMCVHGTLHLLGYDHIEEEDAAQMEALEIKILNQLGYDNPYHIHQNTH